MRYLLLILSVLSISSMHAQAAEDSVEIDLQVGDSVVIGACTRSTFTHLDFYRKTRWVGNEPVYDTATGDGFYKSYFGGGDFNIYELPAEYSMQHFRVMGLEVLSNKNTGEPMYIMYLEGPEPNSVIWVDFYEALESGEIQIDEKLLIPRD